MLTIEKACAAYGDLKVLFDVSLHVDKGEIVSLVGSNGAGKTTILQIISGFVPITSGRLTFEGRDLASVRTYKRADLGIAHIPQGRGILNTLSVRDNLYIGAYSKKVRPSLQKNLDMVYELFPILKERQEQMAGLLSGGQQQMLAIGRALMCKPKMLLLDEPSMGLSPLLVQEIFSIIHDVNQSGVTILLVEQNAKMALEIANRAYVLETGSIVMSGDAHELANNDQVRKAYLGG